MPSPLCSNTHVLAEAELNQTEESFQGSDEEVVNTPDEVHSDARPMDGDQAVNPDQPCSYAESLSEPMAEARGDDLEDSVQTQEEVVVIDSNGVDGVDGHNHTTLDHASSDNGITSVSNTGDETPVASVETVAAPELIADTVQDSCHGNVAQSTEDLSNASDAEDSVLGDREGDPPIHRSASPSTRSIAREDPPYRVTKSGTRDQHPNRQSAPPQELQIPEHLSPEEVAQIWMQRCGRSTKDLKQTRKELDRTRATFQNMQLRIYKLDEDKSGLQHALHEVNVKCGQAEETVNALQGDLGAFQQKYYKLKDFAKSLNNEFQAYRVHRQDNKKLLHEARTAKNGYHASTATLRASTRRLETGVVTDRRDIAAIRTDVHNFGKNIALLDQGLQYESDQLRKERKETRQLKAYIVHLEAARGASEKVAQQNVKTLIEWMNNVAKKLNRLQESADAPEILQAVEECLNTVKAWDLDTLASHQDVSNLAKHTINLETALSRRGKELHDMLENISTRQNGAASNSEALKNQFTELADLVGHLKPDLEKAQSVEATNIELRGQIKGKEAQLEQANTQLKEHHETQRALSTNADQEKKRYNDAESQLFVKYNAANSSLGGVRKTLEDTQKQVSDLEQRLQVASSALEQSKKLSEESSKAAESRLTDTNSSWQQKISQAQESARKEAGTLQSSIDDLQRQLYTQTEKMRKQTDSTSELQVQLDKLNADYEQLEQRKDNALAEKAQAGVDLDKSEQKGRQLSTQKSELASELAAMRSNAEKTLAASEEVRKDRDQKAADLTTVRLSLQEAENAARRLAKEKSDVTAEVSKATNRIISLQEKARELERVKNDLNTATGELQRLRPFETECSRLNFGVDELKKTKAATDEANKSLRSDLDACTVEANLVPGLRKEILEQQKETQALQKNLSDAEKQSQQVPGLQERINNQKSEIAGMISELEKLRPMETELQTLRKDNDGHKQNLLELKKSLTAAEERHKSNTELADSIHRKDQQISKLQSQIKKAGEDRKTLGAVIEESQQKDTQIAGLKDELNKLRLESQQREQMSGRVMDLQLLSTHVDTGHQRSDPAQSRSVRFHQDTMDPSNDQGSLNGAANLPQPLRKVADRSGAVRSQRPQLPQDELEIANSQSLSQQTEIVPDSQSTQALLLPLPEPDSDSSSLSDLSELPDDEIDDLPVAVPQFVKPSKRVSGQVPSPLQRMNSHNHPARPSSSSSMADLFQKHETTLSTQHSATSFGSVGGTSQQRSSQAGQYELRPPQSGQGSQYTISPLRLRNGSVHGAELAVSSTQNQSPVASDTSGRHQPNTSMKRVNEDPQPTQPRPRKKKRHLERMSVRDPKIAGVAQAGRPQTTTPSQRGGGSIIGTAAPIPSSSQRPSKAPRKGSRSEGYAKQFGY